MPLAPNQLLYEYRIECVLGQGAFGVVYLAHDTLLDRPVAIKELTIARQTDDEAFKRFLQEARVAGNINHPHIVTVHALKVAEPTVYLVMEYLTGGSLRALLEERGALPVEDAVRIAADVCEGLAAAHLKGIVHRDVKPENILLTEDGRAKVGDFGIAHMPRGAGGMSLTQAGFQPGTLVYMSPEQIRGQPVDERSDVYQVGALLYEMLTGRHYVDMEALERRARDTAGANAALFQARLYELLAEIVCEREPVGVCQIQIDIPGWVEKIVAATLRKDAEVRLAIEDLARALREGIADPNGSSTPTEMLTGLASFIGNDTYLRRYDQNLTYTQQGCSEEAINEWQNALRINPSDAVAHYNLGVAYAQRGHLQDAIHEWQNALGINPDLAEAHYNLGGAYEQQGRLGEAIREWQNALRVNPDLAEAHDNLGVVYGRQGRLGDAIREHQAALRINPNLAKAHCNLGVAYEQQGHLENAICEYQAALHINPDSIEAHYNLGVAYEQQGHLENAICEYQAALHINPDLVEVHYNLGVVYRNLNRLEDAIHEWQNALGINPDLAEAHYNLGVVHRKLGRLEDAICAYKSALHINPSYTKAYYNLGMAYFEQGRLEDAIHEWQSALRVKPDLVEAHYNLGVVYGEQGRLEDEIREYKAALYIDPNCADARYNLGMTYLMQDRLNEAVGELQVAARLGQEQAREVLKQAGLL